MRSLGPILLFILACGGGPEADGAQAYVSAMQPTLQTNASLAQRFLTDASKVKKKETDGGQLAQSLAQELAPEAESLSRAVQGIDPADPKLKDTHAILVKAWQDRADAYDGMRDAWTRGDLTAWDLAQKKNTQSKLDEERYFAEVNAYLAPYELSLDQYPQ